LSTACLLMSQGTCPRILCSSFYPAFICKRTEFSSALKFKSSTCLYADGLNDVCECVRSDQTSLVRLHIVSAHAGYIEQASDVYKMDPNDDGPLVQTLAKSNALSIVLQVPASTLVSDLKNRLDQFLAG